MGEVYCLQAASGLAGRGDQGLNHLPAEELSYLRFLDEMKMAIEKRVEEEFSN
jgi:hypothetical protein